MKVLSPAGDMESLKMAVFNGADEVYLGVKDFNARNIEGFNLQTLKQAVDFAHIYGVRVFLTVNILFANDEVQQALDLVVDACNLGVDAFIVQDWGLAHLIYKHYPQIEMHASTQMGIHNLEGVREVEKLGFKRVVLARETPLSEIKRINENSNIEIEYFVQGALCVSFSGNCYMSSYMFNASGNRGKCKQLCRLPYEFRFKGKTLKQGYLLSAKDFNMQNRLNDLQKAGVTSLKIEGRARRPYYVATATKMYRQAVDRFKTDNDIELAFNRGYVEGYLNGNSGIISQYQNHVGLAIGKVESVNVGKRFNEVFISSSVELSPKSTFKFFENSKEIAVLTAHDLTKKGKLFRITTTQIIPVGAKVHLIADYEKERLALSQTKKVDVNINITCKVGEEILAAVNCGKAKFELKGEVCERAKNAPLTLMELQANFNKSEYFKANVTANIENVFMPKNKLNEFRRNVFDRLEKELTLVNRINPSKVKVVVPNPTLQLENFQITSKESGSFTAKNVIYTPEIYTEESITEFVNECEMQNKKPYLNLPNFALKEDVELLKQLVNKLPVGIVVNNPYAFSFNKNKIIGGGMNVYNSFAAQYWGLNYLSAESGNVASTSSKVSNNPPHNTVRMPYITLRHCPMKEHLNANCANCPYKDGFTYKMANNTELKLKRIKLSSCTFYLVD